MTLTVIEGIKNEPAVQIDYTDIHLKATFRSYKRFMESQDRTDLLKAVNHGVRCADTDDIRAASFELRNIVFSSVMYILGQITPRELMQVFPVSKEYDGHRWECKDYFYTMKELKAHGLDKPLGGGREGVLGILWDYMNDTTRMFLVGYTGVMSDIYRMETGKGIMETWLEENGVKPRIIHTDERTGKQYLYDGETGKTMPVTKKRPRYLKLLDRKGNNRG